jgi:hypothetical protein
MKILRNVFVMLMSIGLATPGAGLAHPGHQHSPGILNTIDHASIGWDQLLILFVIAGVAIHYLLRARK